ncbi:hypothetical protein GGI07_000500 [Coemansia sp. Benny D115]|nr:hypothetical protein GGI07_000500 [Coemansia sp. Benny D115]
MDSPAQQLRMHDYTVLATLSLTAIYSRIGLQLEVEAEDCAVGAAASAGARNGFGGKKASPHTGHGKRARQSDPKHTPNGRSSSIGSLETRKRKSAFEYADASADAALYSDTLLPEPASRMQSPEGERHKGAGLARRSRSKSKGRFGADGGLKSAFSRVRVGVDADQAEMDGTIGLRARAIGRPREDNFDVSGAGSGAGSVARPQEYGEVWFGRYQILAKLGEGAFSQAFLAADLHCTRMGRRHDGTRLVSIKRMGAREGAIGVADHNTITRLNALDPRNRVPIIRAYDVFQHQVDGISHVCLVMEPLLGGTLHDAFPRRVKALYASHDPEVAKLMHMDMIRSVTRQILLALAHMHSNGLIHADIKTTNLICADTQTLRTKLIDFGNAVSDSDVVEYYQSFEIQTVWFRAPEVAYQRPFGRAIDLWSVGCVLCELWLGCPLFTDMENRGLVASMLKLRGPPPASLYAKSPVYGEAVRAWSSTRPPIARAWDSQLRAQWLKHSLRVDDDDFVALADALLDYDPEQRPTAAGALEYAFFDGVY